MSDFFHLLLASLAVFRSAELIVTDNGPWACFRRLRECSTHPMWCELVSCQYCCGMHLSWMAALFLGVRGAMPWIDAPLWTLAIAGGAVAIMRFVRVR